MAEVRPVVNSESRKADSAGTADHAFEAWKHFASVGGADKNTMVNVASWLLGFSATIIGYIAAKLLKACPFEISQPVTALFLAGLGCLTSLAAGFVALLYGGYANWNWGRAKDIARDRKWDHLLPDWPNAPPNDKPRGLTAFATWLADPNCAPTHLAPIFGIFFSFAMLSVLIHLTILVWSAFHIK